MHGDVVVAVLRRSFPKRNSGVSSIFAQNVIRHISELQLIHISVIVADDTLQSIQPGFNRRHAVPHVFDNGVGARDLNVFFSAAGGARRAHILIGVAASANNRRVAYPSGKFESKTTGGGASGNLTLLVERRTMNGASRRRQNAANGGGTKF